MGFRVLILGFGVWDLGFIYARYTFTLVFVNAASPAAGSEAGLSRAMPFTPRSLAQRPTAVWPWLYGRFTTSGRRAFTKRTFVRALPNGLSTHTESLSRRPSACAASGFISNQLPHVSPTVMPLISCRVGRLAAALYGPRLISVITLKIGRASW